MSVHDYGKSRQQKPIFVSNFFQTFTDQCGGDPEELAEILHVRYIVDDFAYHDDMVWHGVYTYLKEKAIPHKIAVYEAGMELLDNPFVKDQIRDQAAIAEYKFNLWVHDLSKFSAKEVFGYAYYNFSDPHPASKAAFEKAWHHHKMNNPHHPEYWLNPNKAGLLEPIQMPDIFILEMIADWMGAGKTYGETLESWLPKNISRFNFGISAPQICMFLNRILYAHDYIVKSVDQIVHKSAAIAVPGGLKP